MYIVYIFYTYKNGFYCASLYYYMDIVENLPTFPQENLLVEINIIKLYNLIIFSATHAELMHLNIINRNFANAQHFHVTNNNSSIFP